MERKKLSPISIVLKKNRRVLHDTPDEDDLLASRISHAFLDRYGIKDISFRDFSKTFPNLLTFQLRENRISFIDGIPCPDRHSDLSLYPKLKLMKLQEFIISSNKIKSSALLFLLDTPYLSTIDISHNSIDILKEMHIWGQIEDKKVQKSEEEGKSYIVMPFLPMFPNLSILRLGVQDVDNSVEYSSQTSSPSTSKTSLGVDSELEEKRTLADSPISTPDEKQASPQPTSKDLPVDDIDMNPSPIKSPLSGSIEQGDVSKEMRVTSSSLSSQRLFETQPLRSGDKIEGSPKHDKTTRDRRPVIKVERMEMKVSYYHGSSHAPVAPSLFDSPSSKTLFIPKHKRPKTSHMHLYTTFYMCSIFSVSIRLRVLDLKKCAIKTISLAPSPRLEKFYENLLFPELREIDLSFNDIQDESEVEKIVKRLLRKYSQSTSSTPMRFYGDKSPKKISYSKTVPILPMDHCAFKKTTSSRRKSRSFKNSDIALPDISPPRLTPEPLLCVKKCSSTCTLSIVAEHVDEEYLRYYCSSGRIYSPASKKADIISKYLCRSSRLVGDLRYLSDKKKSHSQISSLWRKMKRKRAIYNQLREELDEEDEFLVRNCIRK
ncbi:hypothetical protein ADUPG1_010853 [Aduncisulcus paluster]|uniref:Uncharacterized protein n=1 Tax=Aduncisulcus paluster TaxID=2918883 RepID=A0ABQ5JWM0_9EUKA|nr:hypothetical protein ADUPG1_010853 [Aduncisulcus paluster]